MEFTDNDLHLIQWLTAGHPNERDEDVQKLVKKCARIMNQRKKIPYPEPMLPSDNDELDMVLNELRSVAVGTSH